MKKISIILALFLITFLFACGNNNKKSVGMPNPMVSVSNESEFTDKLGINFYTSNLPKDNFKQFIISDKVGDARFTVNNIECMFRCTKDDEIGKKLSGIYDSDMTEVENNLDYDMVTIKTYKAPNEGYMIYNFKYFDKIYYELAIKGVLNDADLDNVIKSCIRCTGVNIK